MHYAWSGLATCRQPLCLCLQARNCLRAFICVWMWFWSYVCELTWKCPSMYTYIHLDALKFSSPCRCSWCGTSNTCFLLLPRPTTWKVPILKGAVACANIFFASYLSWQERWDLCLEEHVELIRAADIMFDHQSLSTCGNNRRSRSNMKSCFEQSEHLDVSRSLPSQLSACVCKLFAHAYILESPVKGRKNSGPFRILWQKKFVPS